MLANQARRFGETLVDRHVLSRDDLEQAIEESERTKQALPSVLLQLGLVGSKDLTAALADQMGVPVRRLPRDADPPGRARDAARPSSPASTSRCRSTSRATSSSSRSRSRRATTRWPRSVTRRAYEVIPAVADRAELMRAIDDDLRRRRRRRVASSTSTVDGRRRRARGRAAHQRPARARHPVGRFRPPPRVGLAAGHPRARRAAPGHRAPDLQRLADPPDGLLDPHARSSGRSSRTSSSSTRRTRCPGRGRFRVNVFLQRDSVGCVMRAIPYEIVDFDALGIAAGGAGAGRTCRAASCSSPARPVRASRRRSRR